MGAMRMNKHGLTKEDLLRTLPQALRNDLYMAALGEAAVELLAARPAEIDRLRIYPNIDALPEELLDILAYDFKIDWWDPELTLLEKRQVLKGSWNVHRRLGTAWAVKQTLAVSLPGATVREWPEYGGTPYCFQIDCPLPDSGITAEKQSRALERVWYYKNLRSHLEGFKIHWENGATTYLAACAETRLRGEVWPKLTTALESAGLLSVEAVGKTRQSAEVWPRLATGLESRAVMATSTVGKTRQSVEVWPRAAKTLESSGKYSAVGLSKSRLRADIYPDLKE